MDAKIFIIFPYLAFHIVSSLSFPISIICVFFLYSWSVLWEADQFLLIFLKDQFGALLIFFIFKSFQFYWLCLMFPFSLISLFILCLVPAAFSSFFMWTYRSLIFSAFSWHIERNPAKVHLTFPQGATLICALRASFSATEGGSQSGLLAPAWQPDPALPLVQVQVIREALKGSHRKCWLYVTALSLCKSTRQVCCLDFFGFRKQQRD